MFEAVVEGYAGGPGPLTLRLTIRLNRVLPLGLANLLRRAGAMRVSGNIPSRRLGE
jgi:hypothetical protein